MCGDTPELITHWLFHLNGTYCSQSEPPLRICVREDGSLLATLPEEGLSEVANFTVEYTPSPVETPGLPVELEITYCKCLPKW